MATEKEILGCLALLTASYPDWQKNLTADQVKQTSRAYVQLLADMDGNALKVATLEAIKTLKWFPKIAELRELTAAAMRDRKARGLMQPVLPAPPPSPEERQAVKSMIAKLAEKLSSRTLH